MRGPSERVTAWIRGGCGGAGVTTLKVVRRPRWPGQAVPCGPLRRRCVTLTPCGMAFRRVKVIATGIVVVLQPSRRLPPSATLTA